MSGYHADAGAAYNAIPAPDTLEGVASAQRAVTSLWERRGSYGCERHLMVAAMRRVSAILYAPRGAE